MSRLHAPRPGSARPSESAAAGPIALELLTFEEFYRAEYHQLIGLGYVLSGNRSVAEDLVQDAFTEAHRRWSVVATYEHPGAWIRRVLVNKATSRGRRLMSEAKMLTRVRAQRPPDVALSEHGGEVWAAVRQLPRRQAQAVALRYWEDLSVAQIAAVLDCGEETVKTHLKRGRATLSDSLGHERPDER